MPSNGTIFLACPRERRDAGGHEAARFIQALRHLLEQPALLFMEQP
jgi:pyruvate/2-oxoglutarate dehydrogenase complex dihydrolipoamide acyltransferase (E2) component